MNYQGKKLRESGFLDSVNMMFDRAADRLNLSDDLATAIRNCNSTYEVQFTVRLRGRLHLSLIHI